MVIDIVTERKKKTKTPVWERERGLFSWSIRKNIPSPVVREEDCLRSLNGRKHTERVRRAQRIPGLQREKKQAPQSESVGWSGLTSVWPITALADHPHCTRPTPSPPLEFARTVGTRSKFEMKVGDVNGIAVGIRPDGKLKYQIVSC